ncbi:MAG: hypothetical protein GY847_11905 [Proteobacteria bacterium]|nr:hypothetical protein [Pseudomonadota bacterium]
MKKGAQSHIAIVAILFLLGCSKESERFQQAMLALARVEEQLQGANHRLEVIESELQEASIRPRGSMFSDSRFLKVLEEGKEDDLLVVYCYSFGFTNTTRHPIEIVSVEPYTIENRRIPDVLEKEMAKSRLPSEVISHDAVIKSKTSGEELALRSLMSMGGRTPGVSVTLQGRLAEFARFINKEMGPCEDAVPLELAEIVEGGLRPDVKAIMAGSISYTRDYTVIRRERMLTSGESISPSRFLLFANQRFNETKLKVVYRVMNVLAESEQIFDTEDATG